MSPSEQSANTIHRVLILGDNAISISIAQALAQSKNNTYEVHITTPITPPQTHSVFQTHLCTLTRTSLHNLFTTLQPTIIISTVSGGAISLQKLIIDTAISSGVKHFIPDEFGPDSLNPAVQQRLPPCAARAEVIEYLAARASRGEISWVGVAVGTILDSGLRSGNLGFDLPWQSATVHGRREVEFVGCSTGWIGRVVHAVLGDWDKVRDRYLYVCGVRTCAQEVLGYLEKVMEREWMVGETSVAECVVSARRRTESGVDLDGGLFLLQRSLMYDEEVGASRAFEGSDDRELLGLQPERLEDIVRRVVHDYREHGGASSGCGCD